MFKNKENTKPLSDDDFERIGRKKKTLIFIITFIIILAAIVIAFNFIKRYLDNDINVEHTEAIRVNRPEEKTVDEPADSSLEITEKMMAEEENQAKMLPAVRNTVTGENEFICEYSEIHLPELLRAGDCADVRLSLADGRNYTVVSGKKIMDFDKSAEKSLVYLALCEEEIIILDSALSDLKLFEGSKLYLAIGKQENPSKVNYPVNKQADKLLNVKDKANNLSGYDYEVKFDKGLEKERLRLRKIMGLKGQEWKETASYWNEKE